jgi:hypothetical protein
VVRTEHLVRGVAVVVKLPPWSYAPQSEPATGTGGGGAVTVGAPALRNAGPM